MPEPAARALTGGLQLRWSLSWRDMLVVWQQGDGLAFGQQLLGCGYDACFFECPALTRSGLDAPLECVLLDAPELAARAADPADFREHFATADHGIATFGNISGDATLVVPTPVMASSQYGHLLAFLRQAGKAQQAHFWQQAAVALHAVLGETPHWFNTAGMGVPWLHLRIDQRPKYYRHRPYQSL